MKNITMTLATLCFALVAGTCVADNSRSLEFGDNSRPLTFPNNTRTLSFDGPPITFPEPQYSLDMLRNHPLNPASAPGHASYSPGTARWFRPGFGYQVPYSNFRKRRYQSLYPYLSEYAFGIRRPNPRRNNVTYRFYTNAYGGPWYFPGSRTNTTPRVFNW